MTDILIKNMEMPSKCFDCGFCHDGERIRYCLATPWQKEIRKEVFPKRREDFCPLVELPPHGRLIDATELEASDAILIGDDAWNMVHNAPTVLEANNGTDN